jgi:hexokinase
MPDLTTRLRALALVLDDEQLQAVRNILRQRLEEGLAAPGRELAMLPAFLPPPPPGLAGEAVAMDAGGTHLRAARVVLAPGRVPGLPSGVAGEALPGAAGRPASDAAGFFAAHSRVLAAAGGGAGLPVGYCFSYPITSRPDGDAVLNAWTKEVRVEGMLGRAVGALLREHLSRAGHATGPVVVLNDTIAALEAGVSLPGVAASRAVGLIVGTGTNMGAFLPTARIPKLDEGQRRSMSHMAVNFESGAFVPPGLGPADEAVDRASLNPGAQRFEKAVSGAYLGQVFSAAALALGLPLPPGEVETRQVSEWAAAAGDGPLNSLARAVLARSADLVAAALAATADLLGGEGDLNVCAEGSLFWKGPGYAPRVRTTLERLLDQQGTPAAANLFSVENANLVGSALAALTPR